MVHKVHPSGVSEPHLPAGRHRAELGRAGRRRLLAAGQTGVVPRGAARRHVPVVHLAAGRGTDLVPDGGMLDSESEVIRTLEVSDLRIFWTILANSKSYNISNDELVLTDHLTLNESL